MKSFFKTWYVPSNATIAIVGDFDVAETKKLVEKWFGSVPGEQEAGGRDGAGAGDRRRTTVTVEDSFAKQRQVTFAWHSPAQLRRR